MKILRAPLAIHGNSNIIATSKCFTGYAMYDEQHTPQISLRYFSTPSCRVCSVLRPKIESLLKQHFPQVSFIYVDSEKQPEEAARNMVFSAPVIIVSVDDREFFRYARNISLHLIETDLRRICSLIAD